MTTRYIAADFSSTADATPAYVLPAVDTVFIAAGVLGYASGAGSAVVSGGIDSNVVLAGQLFSVSGPAIDFSDQGCGVVVASGGSAVGQVGVQFFGGANTLTNDGLIYGDLAGVSRLNVRNSGEGDTLINHGTIGGGFYAVVYVDQEVRADSLVNTGTLDGMVRLGGGDDRFDSSAGTLTGQVRGGPGNDTLIGSAYADALWGQDDDDTLQGNAGDDLLTGGRGADQLTGGAGLDIASYFGSVAVRASLSNAAANTGDAAGDLYSSIEGLWGSDADDVLTGNNGANVLDGRAGADRLAGLLGNDVYWVDDAGDVVRDVAGGGRDTVYSTVSFSLAGTQCEALVLRGGGNLSGLGSSAADTIRGNFRVNLIDGGAGNDLLFGGAGADTFRFDTPLSGTSNVDRLADYVVADDSIALDRSIFTALAAPGALPASMFRVASGARDASDRIVYDADSGRLLYDPDGTGDLAAVLFAVLAPDLPLLAGDFTILA